MFFLAAILIWNFKLQNSDFIRDQKSPLRFYIDSCIFVCQMERALTDLHKCIGSNLAHLHSYVLAQVLAHMYRYLCTYALAYFRTSYLCKYLLTYALKQVLAHLQICALDQCALAPVLAHLREHLHTCACICVTSCKNQAKVKSCVYHKLLLIGVDKASFFEKNCQFTISNVLRTLFK